MTPETLLKTLALPLIAKANLGVLLQKDGESLNYWVKKLIKNSTLIPLKKGLFISTIYLQSLKSNSPALAEMYYYFISNQLRQPSYISGVSVLAAYGFIPEAVFAVTAVTTKATRTYETKIGRFYYQKIKPELFTDFKSVEFKDKQVQVATFAKAIFDYLYLRPFQSISELKDYLLESGRLNWDTLTQQDKDEFAAIVSKCKIPKLNTVLNILQKNKII